MMSIQEKLELKELYNNLITYSDEELESMNEDQLGSYLELLEAREEFQRYNKLFYFEPDDWFKVAINKMVTEPVVGVLCGNRMGKTYSSTWLYACHLIGYYPEWYEGYRYKVGIDTWYLTSTAEQTVQAGGLQEYLLGKFDDMGSGWLPKDYIQATYAGMGTKNFIKKTNILHSTGTTSTMEMKSYSQSIVALMGASISFAMIDEECPYDVLTQVITRTSTPATGKNTGRVLVAMTCEKGMSKTVEEFWEGSYKDGCVRATVWDCSQLTEEDIEGLKKRYPPHQHDMRLKGIPTMGQGAVYPHMETEIKFYSDDVEIQPHWKVAAAFDFGYKPDPHAVLFGALDPETGVTYVFKEFYETEKTPAEIAGWIKRFAPSIPIIYPADGNRKQAAADGLTMVDLFRAEGLDMNTRVDYGKAGLRETGHTQIRTLFRQGQLYIANTCINWFKEFRVYQYSDKGTTDHCVDHAQDCLRYLIQKIEKVGRPWAECQSVAKPRQFRGSAKSAFKQTY